MAMHSKNSNGSGIDSAAELGLSTSMVCHYLINAFCGVVSRIELMAMDDLDPAKFKELSQTIVDTAKTASSVARSLSDRAALLGAPQKVQLPLGPIVEASVARARAQAADSITWSVSVKPVPPVLADQELIAELLQLVLRNAVEAVSDAAQPGASETVDKAIQVELYLSPDDRVTIDVTDSGPAISPDAQSRAFEPFFTTKSGHEGLGLTLAKSIARRHHGSVSIKPAPSAGTILRLKLPAMQTDTAGHSPAANAPPSL